MMKQVKTTMPLRMLALICGLILSATAFAQQITVKGNVKDATGEAVIGATIRVVGQSGGAISDFDGNFTLKANQGDKLSVSFVGYQEAVVAAAPTVEVVLKDDSQLLENVVVIGYGRAKKDDLTGSVTAIKPDEMSKGITNSASDMLVGKVAGVDVITAGGSPGAGAQIRIRGGASLSASNDPLYVIDGLPIDGNTAQGMTNVLAMINPNDIETFTVLKDASATAIYGSRASNGVIIITTKKGRAGQAPKVSYNGEVTASLIQKKYDVLNAADYRALVERTEGLDASLLGDADTDWQDEIFRTAISSNHSLSLTGGIENMPYRVGVGFNAADGIIKTSYMRRFNASVNLAPSLLDQHLNLNITAKYMHEKNRYADSGAALGSALSIDPTRPVYDNGADYKFTGGFWQSLINASDYSDAEWTKTTNSNAPQNPVAALENQRTTAFADDFTANFEADYKIHGFEDLHIHANYGGQYTASEQHDWTSPYSWGANYYGWDGKTNYYKYSITANAYAQYAHEFGVHNVDVMAGAETSHFHSLGYNWGQGTDFKTGEANNPTNRKDTEWATHNSLLSYFGRLNYSILSRYMLTATFRADGSSRFAPGKKWGYFPSVAFAWKINEEPFLKNVDALDELKLRLGWGQTGQQNGIADFYYVPLYVRSNPYAQYPFGSTYYYTTRPNVYNPDLTWETTTTWNAGLDFSFLNGRIAFNIDGYFRKTTDLLSTVDIPSGINFGDQMMQNIGNLENYGMEFAINVKPVVTKDFTWDLSYNIGWNHNEITELKAGGDDYVWVSNTISRGNGTRIQRNAVGYPANSFFVYQQVYDEMGMPIEGLYVDRNADGMINDDDRYYYKKPAADVVMGLTTKFLWKNWDLSAAFHASLGNYVYYDFLSDKASLGGLYTNSSFHNTTPEAVELGFSGVTTVGDGYWISDYFVQNASYLKCSNITLGYTFPALFKNHCSGRIYATAQNPFMITKYKGIDPEVASGIDRNPYPRPMSFQLGVNLNF